MGAPSGWLGRAAEILSLSGDVGDQQLEALLRADGFGRQYHPRARLGTDLTVSSPKSVSIAALVLGDTRLLTEHDQAVRAMLDYVETTCVTTRAGKGGRTRLWTGNLAAAIYRHEDARAIDGWSDPDLHSHAIIGNVTRRHDGAWRTIDLDFGPRSARLHLANAVYLARLAHGARRRCGYGIAPTAHGWELVGLDVSARDAFSRRRRAVDARLAERGTSRRGSSARQRAIANYTTRQPKGSMPGWRQRREWRERARRLGLRLEDIQAIDDSGEDRDIDALASTAVADALEQNGTNSEADILRAALATHYGALRLKDVLGALRRAHGAVGSTDNRMDHSPSLALSP